MLYGSNIQDTRSFFQKSWRKYQNQSVLEPLENQIVSVIPHHPEYHALISLDKLETSTFSNDNTEPYLSNPYMHMGLHLALRDQINLDKPSGIRTIYETLYSKLKNHHHAEHAFMPILLGNLATAINEQKAFDESGYIKSCKILITNIIA